ncbi:MAG: DUF4145 domain-containing protein [Bacilli bacterium]|nr:DUF4145 domain-containing protein [Bacilli bacterium]
MEYVNKDIKIISILFGCPSCGKGFVTHYDMLNRESTKGNYKYTDLKLIDSFPKIPNSYNFDDCIEKLSPDFCKIYNQAYKAEFYNLDSIAGIGYRKSLEFLIKDYSITKNSAEEENIKKMPLSQVIDKYIEGDKLRTLSKASTWIGNDEAHYIKKISDKDINDLKRFIASTVAFITYDITSDEAYEVINSESK